MGSLALRNIRKSFGPVEVLHGIDIDVADGEFAVLVGPSGCGKSTLLRAIAGLETIDQGSVAISGRDVTALQPKKRDIAMVFQNYALYPHMKVRDNMAFSLRLARTPQAGIDAKVGNAAQILGLEALLDRYPRQLSGGQRQRVAMGRAIVREPAIFLFDEPLSNLDAKLRVQMRAEIKELHQRLGTTIVYVTHDQIEALTLADKIVVMKDGHVEQEGAPLELYDRPANTFVAGFIGSPAINLLPGRIAAGQAIVTDGTVLSTLPTDAAERSEVVFGVRPEDLMLAETGMAGQVVIVEPTGAETQLLVRAAGANLTLTTRDRIMARPGETVHLAVAPGKMHVFDPASGQALLSAT